MQINIRLYNELLLIVTNQCSLNNPAAVIPRYSITTSKQKLKPLHSIPRNVKCPKIMGLPWYLINVSQITLQNTTVHDQIPWYYHCEWCKWSFTWNYFNITMVSDQCIPRDLTENCYGKRPWYYHCTWWELWSTWQHLQ